VDRPRLRRAKSAGANGVLFLDELPEFKRSALEVMRQPIEDGRVTISRRKKPFPM
jgi:magnesium chelatase family protein